MNRSAPKIVLAVAGILPMIGMAGCVVRPRERVVVVEERRPREVIVEERVPEPRVEIHTARPSEEHIWIDGHWVRVGNHWDWVGGHWDRRPRGEAVWIPGHHERREHGYVWIEGRWQY
jgi:hypothetical protein